MRSIVLTCLLICSSVVSADTLYTNGSILTNANAGAGGFGISQTSEDFNTLGFSVTSPTRLSDDFVVSDNWQISSIKLSAYVTGAYTVPPAASPLTGATLNLWRGAPEFGGSELVATSTNVTSNTFSGIFRVSNGPANFNSTDRPVFDITVGLEKSLSPGIYWIDYSLTGTGGNIFCPMVMINGPSGVSTFNGNAQRKLNPGGTWVTLFGGTTVAQGLDFPFSVFGTRVPEPGCVAGLSLLLVLSPRRRKFP